MQIPPEVVAAKEALEDVWLEQGLVTGIDFGVRDEEEPNPEDLALRIFVSDASNVPIEVTTAMQAFPFPVVVIQRRFRMTQLPDLQPYRPVAGGVSTGPSRLLNGGRFSSGTLGAIVTDPLDPTLLLGLSNYHVLCVDAHRQSGDEIVQPEATILGVLPGSRIGTLYAWSFPETTLVGLVDAAACRLDIEARREIVEIGVTSGVVEPSIGMLVSKRGRTTGRTFGWISGLDGSYPLDYPELPPVVNSLGQATSLRIFKRQMQIHIDFPQSIVFGESGDSGSLVIGTGDRVVGLYFAGGSNEMDEPLKYGVANYATNVERLLGVDF